MSTPLSVSPSISLSFPPSLSLPPSPSPSLSLSLPPPSSPSISLSTLRSLCLLLRGTGGPTYRSSLPPEDGFSVRQLGITSMHAPSSLKSKYDCLPYQFEGTKCVHYTASPFFFLSLSLSVSLFLSLSFSL